GRGQSGMPTRCNVRVLRGGKLVPTFLWVENGKIMDPQARFWRAQTAAEYGPTRVVDGRGLIVAPGFLDVQLNGAYGHDFTDMDCTPENILEVRQRLLATGVTAFCPTVISSSAETYSQVLPNSRARSRPFRSSRSAASSCRPATRRPTSSKPSSEWTRVSPCSRTLLMYGTRFTRVLGICLTRWRPSTTGIRVSSVSSARRLHGLTMA
uniref:N-acetylglucosamine-6-phosphate deacetylase n=1 Tax=Hucho hucho TaxID=62062 RepID=A0A4W5L3E1_9TELE